MENVIALYSRDRIEIVSVTQARGVNMMMMAVFMTYKSKANIVTNDLYETFLNVGAISNIIKVLLNRNEV